jgi:hypothetical protein
MNEISTGAVAETLEACLFPADQNNDRK